MKILALEFSSPERSVAVIDSSLRGQSGVVGFASEMGGRSTRAISLIEHALSQAKCEQENIKCLAVGLGPGSYTGIRASIALAKGWTLARPMKVIGLGSYEGFARQIQAAGLYGEIRIVIDAQRHEFYTARFAITAEDCRETEGLHIISLAEIEQRAAAGEMLVSPDISQWKLAQVNAAGPTAIWLGRLAAGKMEFSDVETIEPIYLRETHFVRASPPRTIS